jgi:hypothetical protein
MVLMLQLLLRHCALVPQFGNTHTGPAAAPQSVFALHAHCELMHRLPLELVGQLLQASWPMPLLLPHACALVPGEQTSVLKPVLRLQQPPLQPE